MTGSKKTDVGTGDEKGEFLEKITTKLQGKKKGQVCLCRLFIQYEYEHCSTESNSSSDSDSEFTDGMTSLAWLINVESSSS